MKIEFTFDNVTQLEELYYTVEDIPQDILDDAEELGTPDKEDQALYDVILKLKEKLIEVRSKRVPEVNLKTGKIELEYKEEEEGEDYNPELDAASYT